MNADHTFVSWEAAVAWLRQQPGQAKLVADCYYDDPLMAAAKRYQDSEEWQAVRMLLTSPTGHALDVGAGRGITSYALAREGFQVTAVEPDPSALVGTGAIRALAAESGLPIQVVAEVSERLPFPDAAFDLVFARAVLHHTNNLRTACGEFSRVLKPGGLFLAIREHVISAPSDLARFLDQHPLHHLYGGEHAYLLSDYVTALDEAGFSGLKTISPWHSAINYAPRTLDELKEEVAQRAGLGFGMPTRLVRRMLAAPFIWHATCHILERIDRRPGRLFSFLAEKT